MVLAGDYNVVPTPPQDIYATRSLDDNALIQPGEPTGHLAFCWLKAGLMPCGSYIRTGRSGHSGITSLKGGRGTKACDSITFCSHRICRSGSWTVVLTDGAWAKKTRATMRQHGSCSISRTVIKLRRPLCLPLRHANTFNYLDL